MVLSGLVLGGLLGFVMQRGRFCVTGAFREVWVSKRTRWLTAFLIVIAVQSVGVFALDSLGVINLAPESPLPLAAVIVGSLIFGFSIVLAGGCATGTYYRAGEGLIGSWLALIFYALFAAIMKYGPLAGANSGLRAQQVPLTSIHETFGISPWLLVAALVAVVGYVTWRHLRKPKLAIASLPPRRTGLAYLLFEKPWHPFATAVVIGVIAIAAFPLSYATGRESGLGITTPSANLINFLTTGNTDRGFNWGVMLIIGLLIGSFIAAKASGEFRLRVPDARTAARSVIGGAGMGIGAAWAGGCTIGNAMVNTALFSYQGWLAFGFMLLGTGIAARVFIMPHKRAGAFSSAQPQPATVSA